MLGTTMHGVVWEGGAVIEPPLAFQASTPAPAGSAPGSGYGRRILQRGLHQAMYCALGCAQRAQQPTSIGIRLTLITSSYPWRNLAAPTRITPLSCFGHLVPYAPVGGAGYLQPHANSTKRS